MSENVVSLATRLEVQKAQGEEVTALNRTHLLGALDEIRARVESGETTGLGWVEVSADAFNIKYGYLAHPAVSTFVTIGGLEILKLDVIANGC